jgi:multisubunit Na+/H+ antiporter MnhE subunit
MMSILLIALFYSSQQFQSEHDIVFNAIITFVSIILYYIFKYLILQKDITLYQFDKEFSLSQISFVKFIKYIIFLIKEVFASSLNVIKIILYIDSNDNDCLIKVPIDRKKDYGTEVENKDFEAFLYATSITITPGTITCHIDLHNNYIVVHAMNDSFTQDLKSGTFGSQISNIFYKK